MHHIFKALKNNLIIKSENIELAKILHGLASLIMRLNICVWDGNKYTGFFLNCSILIVLPLTGLSWLMIRKLLVSDRQDIIYNVIKAKSQLWIWGEIMLVFW